MGNGGSRTVLAVAGAALVVAGAVAAMSFASQPVASERTASASPTTIPSPTAPATAAPVEPTSVPSATPAVSAVAVVPVVGFWSSERDITRADLAKAITSGSRPIVVATDVRAFAASLGVVPGGSVRQADDDEVRAAVASSRDVIGILPASDVTPDVRALSVGGRSLFGGERVQTLDAWPLVVMVPDGNSGVAAFDPTTAWTLAAGGDVMLDRAVYEQAVLARKGADFPWDGAAARIAGTRCCGADGARLPVGERTGNAGAVRSLLSDADVAVVNLEGPSPDSFRYHPHGLVFSFDPALLPGLARAGIDAVGLANNHIRNAGARGVLQTVGNLDEAGIAHAGAGRDLAAARGPALLSGAGVSVAVLAYDAIRPDLDATASTAGAAPLRVKDAAADIRAAKAAGADVVVVLAHWGTEYTDRVSPSQRSIARALVRAGADVVLGSHSHVVGPFELIDGRPVFYSLGDLVFDLNHDERTLEGVIVDLTFVGTRLVQLDLHPTLILDGSQPNLLDPAADGARLLRAVERASEAVAAP